jgi:hypothetical protein
VVFDPSKNVNMRVSATKSRCSLLINIRGKIKRTNRYGGDSKKYPMYGAHKKVRKKL